MIHTIIVHDPSLFRLIVEQNETKKAPLTNLPYEMYLHGKIRIIGAYEASIEEVLASVVQELNPDTVFFLSKSYPVSDEKLSGDIILPNVFFSHDSSSDAIRFSVNSPFFASPPTRGETLTTSPLVGGSGRGTGREVNNSPGSPSPLFLEHYPIQ